ncbi:MAG TPA: hypothetical protein PLH93_11865 [Flavobacteriales bacterium]|nr:hypothetical protein [Flavobacteriales bacterium]
MNLLRNLFRKPGSIEAPVAEQPSTPVAELAIPAAPPADTFIDLEPPLDKVVQAGSRSKPKTLAAQDLTEHGRDMGFRHHDMDICRSMQERIKAEIVRAIDEEVDQLGRLIAELDVEIAKLQDGPLEQALRALRVRRDQIDRERMKLQEQQLLVAGNSGYVELPLTSFAVGFRLGYAAHLESVLLLTKYQG